jgi:hypothetical protein
LRERVEHDAALPSRICAFLRRGKLTPLLFMNVAICWPVASRTMRARARLRNARFRCGSPLGDAGAAERRRAAGSRSGSTMRVSIAFARLNLLAGTFRLALPASPKS